MPQRAELLVIASGVRTGIFEVEKKASCRVLPTAYVANH
jgi:hypothetical protein